MRTPGRLFVATALIEAGTGLGLLTFPALVLRVLLGVRAAAPEALVVGRVGGAALLALGIACWLARDEVGGPSSQGLLWAMLTYNAGASTVLALSGAVWAMAGVALWPAVVLHVVMAIWCALKLPAPRTAATH